MAASTVVGKEVIEVTKELGDMIGTVLQTMADKLNVPVAHIYEVFIKQQVISGIICTIMLALGIIVPIIIMIITHKSRDKDYSIFNDRQNTTIQVLFLGAFGYFMITGAITFFTLDDFVTKIVNPEYHVIKHITEMLVQFKK
jgi:hypothetical protein